MARPRFSGQLTNPHIRATAYHPTRSHLPAGTQRLGGEGEGPPPSRAGPPQFTRNLSTDFGGNPCSKTEVA